MPQPGYSFRRRKSYTYPASGTAHLAPRPFRSSPTNALFTNSNVAGSSTRSVFHPNSNLPPGFRILSIACNAANCEERVFTPNPKTPLHNKVSNDSAAMSLSIVTRSHVKWRPAAPHFACATSISVVQHSSAVPLKNGAIVFGIPAATDPKNPASQSRISRKNLIYQNDAPSVLLTRRAFRSSLTTSEPAGVQPPFAIGIARSWMDWTRSCASPPAAAKDLCAQIAGRSTTVARHNENGSYQVEIRPHDSGETQGHQRPASGAAPTGRYLSNSALMSKAAWLP